MRGGTSLAWGHCRLCGGKGDWRARNDTPLDEVLDAKYPKLYC